MSYRWTVFILSTETELQYTLSPLLWCQSGLHGGIEFKLKGFGRLFCAWAVPQKQRCEESYRTVKS